MLQFVNQDTSHDFLWAYVHNQYTVSAKKIAPGEKIDGLQELTELFSKMIFCPVFKSGVHRIHSTTFEMQKKHKKPKQLYL